MQHHAALDAAAAIVRNHAGNVPKTKYGKIQAEGWIADIDISQDSGMAHFTMRDDRGTMMPYLFRANSNIAPHVARNRGLRLTARCEASWSSNGLDVEHVSFSIAC